jgi:hypothetical protein
MALMLRRNQAVRMAAGMISCLEGTLWVTWKGSDDVILTKGQSVRAPAGSRPVVQALCGPAALYRVTFFTSSRSRASMALSGYTARP